MKKCFFILIGLLLAACQSSPKKESAVEQWTTCEITLEATSEYPNGYTDIEAWGVFTNDHNDSLIRPAFWDGGSIWKIRFAPPDTGAIWTWTTFSLPATKGLSGMKGSLRSVPYTGNNELIKNGLLKDSPGKRNIIHANGKPFLVVGDTPWAIPFRATTGQVKIYAEDRRSRGFNTALLMSVQPDMYAEGPDARNTVLGFARGFDDLHEGHINKLRPDYFQYLDSLMQILVDHGIVPVYQPVFHGFGWKGKSVLGPTADPDEYARYCKYLVARYGSMPAFWLVSGDAHGLDSGVKPGGEMIEKWDCYHQPTGIHYNPADDYLAPWAQGDSSRCFHYNRSYQDEPWLDFQWAQTGHDGKHLYHKVERMYENKPVKACLNGEPTYEGMNAGKNGLGWWQGEEAWNQLMHGGTMGIVYGAVCLWQWKITSDEPGWDTWTDAPMSWEDALKQEGSRYAGMVSRAFDGYDFADMEKRPDLTGGKNMLLARENSFYISYLDKGGEIMIKSLPVNLPVIWFNPLAGDKSEKLTSKEGDNTFRAPDNNPWVIIIGNKKY
ncbi:MAG: DUF4038 domain-containing protein [Bacteroidales bacterium]|nr:DUF4038 domain-containing protein [Bacteroidales bacterium]